MSLASEAAADARVVDRSDLVEAAPAERGLDAFILRWGVTPLFVGIDVLAVVLAIDLSGARDLFGLLFGVTAIAANVQGSLYKSRLTLSLLDDAPRLVIRAFVAAAIAAFLVTLAGVDTTKQSWLWASGCYAGLVLAGRAAAYAGVRSVRRRRRIAHRTLVLGAGRVGGQLASMLLDHAEYGLMPVGFLDSGPLLAESERPVPLLGGYGDLAATIRRLKVGEIVIAFGGERESDMIDILRTCDRMQCDIFFVPRLFEMHASAGDAVDSVWGLPLVRMRRAAFRSPFWRLKRLFDIVGATASLLFLAPVLAVIAVAVRLDGPNVLFRQQRVGLDGRPFDLLKFRTLRPADENESATRWSVVGEPRMTPVGKWLRATSLDELPQLWNVLVGDMTLVGPRPERPYFVDEFAQSLPRYLHRHRVPAGMTGWAQVHGLRGDTSIEERARFDNFYIENWSLWLDVKILARTLSSFLRGAG